jgi:hypothetical protein
MKKLCYTNVRLLRMTRHRGMIIAVWHYVSWAGVKIGTAPSQRKSVDL